MLTTSALRGLDLDSRDESVTTARDLIRDGWSSGGIRSQLAAGRWQREGRAIVRHNGPLTTSEQRTVTLLNSGARSVLTAFTALEEWGLSNWSRERTHVLVPRGARITPCELPRRVHYTDDWRPGEMNLLRRLHRPAPAAALAASSFTLPRPACGVLAAVVQQRLARPDDVIQAVEESTRIRHRAVLLAAAHDIAQGAQALSEIDFARLCRRAGLPEPSRQSVRAEPSGRRRYLDVEWVLTHDRRLVVEVDGALHLAAERWWKDQLRQNEVVISGERVLRFPSVIVRCEEPLVVDQLRRALFA